MSKRAREASAKARVAAQREAVRRQEQRKRTTMLTTIGVIVLIAGAVTWWSVRQSASEQVTGPLAPIAMQPDGSVVMARPGVTSPVVDVYEDYQCPACKQLELTSGSTLKNLAAEGKAKVVYHLLTIFKQEPTMSNSLRASSAARCVTDGAQWLAFHDRLYQEQPGETTAGFAIDDLVRWGRDAGVTAPDFESCVRGQKNVPAHQQYSTQVIATQKLAGTPTVMLDGQSLGTTAFVPSALREAVLDAAK
ncbi:thioredoxin domain-containing protein [Planotetraspora phitsanulokensis]|uniref:Membrane protein n=1 Tax=Planotetraspora phitsanulokensis TaxID=575192 RepID=A0A8J3XCJ1_9ACTN|nr:thioredoxin domain-containing protein [Planotetraspora phitsanulokensis]GII35449.1 membrane protein [Planotetraspora phitsanulokensis]